MEVLTRSHVAQGGEDSREEKEGFREGVSQEVRFGILVEFSKQTREKEHSSGESNVSRGIDTHMSGEQITVWYGQNFCQQTG